MKLKLIPKHQNGYKIQKGDTLSSIAKKFGTTV
jgi:LysM repeat protein